MQLVNDMSGYFAKYIGKDNSAEGLKGRWWGSFNKNALPISKKEERELTEVEHTLVHRTARKLRQKRADAGKHRAIAKRMEKWGFKLSQTDLWRLRSGYDIQGFRDGFGVAFYLGCYKIMCQKEGVRTGKFNFRGKVPSTSSIVVCGRNIVKSVERLVKD